MSSMELPLVFFTVISQLAIGMALVSAFKRLATSGGAGVNERKEWWAVAAVVFVGLLVSLTHLGHPLGAPNAIKHLSTAWLSREVLGVGVFFALTVVTAISAKKSGNPLLMALSAIVGVVTIFFTGMTYAPPSYPAINNILPFVFFLLTACILGPAFAVYFTAAERRPMLARFLTMSLAIALVLYLVIPCVWLSGNEAMVMTGTAWISSGLYWLRIIGFLALPLVIVARLRTVPLWLPVVLLIGELLGRAVFFSETVHTAALIGGVN